MTTVAEVALEVAVEEVAGLRLVVNDPTAVPVRVSMSALFRFNVLPASAHIMLSQGLV